MYLKSLEGLNTLIKQTDSYKAKLKKNDKDLLIDKSNIVINNIVNGNRQTRELKDFEPTPLSTNILRFQLGGNYKDVLDLLISINIIRTDNKYLTTSTAKQYGLTPTAKLYGITPTAKEMKISSVGILTKRIEKKIMLSKTYELDKYLKDEVHSKIINNLKNLIFTLNDLPKALSLVSLDNQEQIDHYTSSFKALHNLNSINSIKELKTSKDFFYSANNKVNRVYHYYAAIPRVYRQYLRHSDGSKLVELDLKNSQPLILTLLLYQVATYDKSNVHISNSNIVKWFQENKENILKRLVSTNNEYIELTKELDRLIDEVINGTFYGTISSFYPGKKNYNELKISILKSFYSKSYKKLSKIEVAIQSKFPYFLKFLRLIKQQRNHKELSHLAQIYESSIFIDKVFQRIDNKIFAIPIHDSIIVKVTHLHIVKRIIIESISDTFNLDVSIAFQLIKITEYE